MNREKKFRTSQVIFFGLCFSLLFFSFYDHPFSLHVDEEKKPMISHQHRFGISKDVWITEDKVRYHHHLLSPESTVMLIPANKGIDAVEHLQQIRCWLQQKIDPVLDEQKVQYIKANEGTYFYKEQEFLARQIIFAFYNEKGSELHTEIHPSHLFFKGKAEQAYFHLHNHQPEFDADEFQVVIDEK